MTTDQFILFSLLGAVFALLVWGKIRYDLVAFGALVVAIIAGVVPEEHAFDGFGHHATVIIALVLVVSRGLSNSGAVELIARHVVTRGRALMMHISIMSGVAAALSALMNNVAALTPRQLAGMVLAFAGVVCIVGEPRLSGNLIHVALVIGGAFTWAVGQIMIKRLGEVGGFVLITWVAVMATPQLFIASWLLESDHLTAIRSASLEIWAAVGYLGVVMTALGYALWYRLLGLYPVSRVMPFLLLLPLISVAGGIIFLGESLTVKVIIGGLCILAGITLINLRLAQVPAADKPPGSP